MYSSALLLLSFSIFLCCAVALPLLMMKMIIISKLIQFFLSCRLRRKLRRLFYQNHMVSVTRRTSHTHTPQHAFALSAAASFCICGRLWLCQAYVHAHTHARTGKKRESDVKETNRSLSLSLSPLPAGS